MQNKNDALRRQVVLTIRFVFVAIVTLIASYACSIAMREQAWVGAAVFGLATLWGIVTVHRIHDAPDAERFDG